MHALMTGRYRTVDVLAGAATATAEQQRLALTPHMLANMGLKLANYSLATPAHRTAAMLLDCGSKQKVTWLLSASCMAISQVGLHRQLDEQMERMGGLAKRLTSFDGFLVLLYDNVHFLNFLAQLSKGQSQALNLIMKTWRQVGKEDADAALKGLSSKGTPWEDLRETTEPKDLLPTKDAHDRLDAARLERIETMLCLNANMNTAPNGMLPPPDMVLPGRDTLQEHTPAAGGTTADAFEGAEYLIDDMAEENLNSLAAVQGLMNDALAVLQQARENGQLEADDYLELVGLFLCGDGNPVSKMIDLKGKYPELYKKLRTMAGGFHTYFNGLRNSCRLQTPTLEEEVNGHRRSAAAKAYLENGAQVRQVMDEAQRGRHACSPPVNLASRATRPSCSPGSLSRACACHSLCVCVCVCARARARARVLLLLPADPRARRSVSCADDQGNVRLRRVQRESNQRV